MRYKKFRENVILGKKIFNQKMDIIRLRWSEKKASKTSPEEERQNVNNTFTHQEIVVSLLNLSRYINFSCLENFKRSFWKVMILQLWR